jgi:hypothetical protein
MVSKEKLKLSSRHMRGTKSCQKRIRNAKIMIFKKSKIQKGKSYKTWKSQTKQSNIPWKLFHCLWHSRMICKP